MKQKIHILQEAFTLESGKTLRNPPIAYNTYGALNSDRSNVIVVCHGLTANSDVRDWWSGIYGEGHLLDPDEYFIICINNMGSPYGTVSPISENPATGEAYGLAFPFFTIRDTARLHAKLLSALGIDKIHLLIGGSCGGNIAQELAYEWRDRIRYLALVCCSSRETPWAIGIHEAQRIALKADPGFEAGSRAGLRAARAFALPFYRSHASFVVRQAEDDNAKVSGFKAASYINYQGEKFIKRYDPFCYWHQLNALDTHNIGRDRGGVAVALGEISAQTVCVGYDTDMLIPPVEPKALAQHIPHAVYREIKTIYGHDSFLILTEELEAIIGEFIR